MKSPEFQKWAIGVGTALLLALFLSPSLQIPLKRYQAGDIATKEIKSTQDILVEDQKSTQEKRAEAERSVFSVYDYDPTVLNEIETRLREAFSPRASLMSKEEWESAFRFSLSQREWTLLKRERFDPAIGETVLKLMTPHLRRGVINDKDLLDSDALRGVSIRNIQTRTEKMDVPPFEFLDLREVRSRMRIDLNRLAADWGRDLSLVVLKLSEQALRPNLTFNKDETEARKAEIKSRVSPVFYQIKRGEVVLRAGERVREEHLLKMEALKKAQERSHLLAVLVGMALLTFLILASLYEFSTKNIRKIALTTRDLLFFCTTLVGMVAFLKVFLLITDILGGEVFSIPASSYVYLFPLAAGTMIVRIVIHSEVAIVFATLMSYFAASLMGNQLFLFIFGLVGSLIGAHKVARCEQRSILLKAGLFVGAANIGMILCYHLIIGTFLTPILLSDLIMGFLGGLLASLVVLGLAPIVESLFGYTTDIKLLELANLDHPLLRDLSFQAPGTYHHSIIVGSLVEAGAKSIAANPLLARVSAYYHDIGKLKKPLYFIENAGGMENRHDHLTPTMSSLILASHVKDGVELAQEYRLGEKIIHIIQQHHGTSLISFFYKKAKEQENPEMGAIDEKDFRYPGPKPQTKEAGIVMLADAVEAASRTLTDPTPSRIKGLVQQIIQNIFLDGQLEECELTLKDLRKIEESFTRILTAYFHQRIDYPLPPFQESEKRPHEDLDSKPPKTYPFRPKKDKKAGPRDLRQAGTS
ncbi:MAG: HDIG domain-containing protein [Desulfobacterota bacterium]|nr:HDIG domain-containing protein [Thermodesulfobacteriota bacterium]